MPLSFLKSFRFYTAAVSPFVKGPVYGGKSYSDGGLAQYIDWTILGWLVTIFTLGICYPWAVVMRVKWKVEHTVIEGRRLKFHGTAFGLFANWIKWWFLCIITLGIYSFWVFIAVEKWI